MAEQSSNLLETVDHLRTIDQLTGRFLVCMAAELRTLDNVFDQLKLEAGWFDLEIQEVDVRQLVERVMSTISGYLAISYGEGETDQDTEVEFRLESAMPEGLPPSKLDGVRIERILTEVLLEAVQISRRSGGKVTFSVEYDKEWLIFEIKDDGVGLPEPLKNQSPSLVPTSQAVVELHGGNLEIKDQAEGGWVFNLKLPAQRG